LPVERVNDHKFAKTCVSNRPLTTLLGRGATWWNLITA
jgi:hypothetical protein